MARWCRCCATVVRVLLVACALSVCADGQQPPPQVPPGFQLPQPAPAGPQLLHPVFQDHAVLQRDSPDQGLRRNGSPMRRAVAVTLAAASLQARAGNRWPMARDTSGDDLPGARTSLPSHRQWRDPDAASDVLIGDVFLCAGQSNMAFSQRQADGAADDARAATDPGIFASSASPPNAEPHASSRLCHFAAVGCRQPGNRGQLLGRLLLLRAGAEEDGERADGHGGCGLWRRSPPQLPERGRAPPTSAREPTTSTSWTSTETTSPRRPADGAPKWEAWWTIRAAPGMAGPGCREYDGPRVEDGAASARRLGVVGWRDQPGRLHRQHVDAHHRHALRRAGREGPGRWISARSIEEDETWVNGTYVGASSFAPRTQLRLPAPACSNRASTSSRRMWACGWRDCGIRGPAENRAIRFAGRHERG